MKGKINFDCYKNSGGADKLNAINYTGVKLNKYDKVIISHGETKESNYNALNFSNSYASRVLTDQCWPQKNTIYSVQRTASSSSPLDIYRRYGHKWFRYNTGSNKSYDEGAGFHYTNDGKVIYYNYEYNSSVLIINNDFNITSLPSYSIYLGQHNNKSYAIQKSNGNICEYDLNTNTLLSNTLYSTGKIQYGEIRDGKIIVSSATKIFILYFDTDDSIKLENTITCTNLYSRALTGAQLGDYMFTSTTKSNITTNSSTSSGYLKCYKLTVNALDGKYIYVEETPKILEKFTTQSCTMNYNPCSGFLTIGTIDNVYMYKFDTQTKEFTEIPLTNVLPEKQESSLYKACVSPDGSEILVSSFASSTISSKVSLTGYNQTIALRNNLENIDVNNYTAIVTKEARPYENVEVTALVPYTANITFNVSPSANNITLIEGEN